MRSAYEGIYGALFEFALVRWWGNENVASRMTAVGLGGIMILNVLLLIGVAVDFFGPLTFIPDRIAGVVAVLPLAITHVAFVRRDRYVEVVRRFRERPASEQRRTKIVAWTYVVLSFVAPFLTLLGFPNR